MTRELQRTIVILTSVSCAEGTISLLWLCVALLEARLFLRSLTNCFASSPMCGLFVYASLAGMLARSYCLICFRFWSITRSRSLLRSLNSSLAGYAHAFAARWLCSYVRCSLTHFAGAFAAVITLSVHLEFLHLLWRQVHHLTVFEGHNVRRRDAIYSVEVYRLSSSHSSNLISLHARGVTKKKNWKGNNSLSRKM